MLFNFVSNVITKSKLKRRREISSIQEFTNKYYKRKVKNKSETKRTGTGNAAIVAIEG